MGTGAFYGLEFEGIHRRGVALGVMQLFTPFRTALLWTFLVAHATSAQDLDPQRVGAWPGYTRGPASAVVIAGDYAYVAAGSLQVFDVSNPLEPKPIGQYDAHRNPWNGINHLALSGHYAYLAHPGGLEVIDISDPALPRRVGGGDTLGWINRVAISGDRAYLAGEKEVQIMDVSNPAQPQVVGRITADMIQDVKVSSHYAYIADCQSGLRIIDVSDPANPRQVGGYGQSGRCVARVALAGSYAYMADHPHVFGTGSPELQVLDISDPTDPRPVGGYATPETVRNIAMLGNYAYLAFGFSGLEVIDISDPANPRPIGACDTPGDAEAVAISGNRAFVADGLGGLQVIDVENPAGPRRVGGQGTSGSATDVFVSGHYACVGDEELGMQILDISNPANPRQVGRFRTDARVVALAGSGQLVCVAELRWEGQQATVQYHLVDISNPSEPRRLSGFTTIGGSVGLAWSGDSIYVTSEGSEGQGQRGRLEAVDVSDPANPQLVGRIELIQSFAAFAVSGRYACVAGYVPNGEAGLQIQVFDFSNPAQPRQAGAVLMSGGADWIYFELAVLGHYVYVAIDNEFRAIDISDPDHPTMAGRLAVAAGAGLAVSGRYAYVGAPSMLGLMWGGIPRVTVIDISDPENPRRLGARVMTRVPRKIAASGPYAFVAVGEGGMEVLDIYHPANPRRLSSAASEGQARQVAASSPYAYVTEERWDVAADRFQNALTVFDVSVSTKPQRAGSLRLDMEPTGVAVSGNHVFVTEAWQDGNQLRGRLNVVDVSDATAPRRVSTAETGGRASAVAVSDRCVYVTVSGTTAGRSRLKVFDVAAPALPIPVGEIEMAGWAGAVAVSSKFACVMASGVGLHVIDISVPAAPKHLASYGIPSTAAIALSGAHAWAAGRGGYLWSIDLSTAASRTLSGSYASDTYWSPTGLALSGRYAYVSDGIAGLHVIDLSDPANLRRVGGNGAFDARAVTVENGKVYVTSPDGVIVVLNSYESIPEIAPTVRVEDSQFHLSLRTEAGQAVRVQRSRDLRIWEDWRSITGAGNPQLLVDENASRMPMQFYRAVTAAP